MSKGNELAGFDMWITWKIYSCLRFSNWRTNESLLTVKLDLTLKFSFEPHLVDVSQASSKIQTALFDLYEDNILKALFEAKRMQFEYVCVKKLIEFLFDAVRISKNTFDYSCLHKHAS